MGHLVIRCLTYHYTYKYKETNKGQKMNTIKNLLGITYRNGYYWTGLYYKGNSTEVGSKTLRSAIVFALTGRF